MTTINATQPEKLLKVKAFLDAINPDVPLKIEDRGEQGWLLVGPYPTFIFFFDNPLQPDGYVISVNADAPQMVHLFTRINNEFPDLAHYGPFCEGVTENMIFFGEDAYKMRQQHILAQADEIVKVHKETQTQQVIAPEKKIIIPGM